MKSRKQKAWDRWTNYLSCEGEWPITNSDDLDKSMKLRSKAMKMAFEAGWYAAKRIYQQKNIK
jgi:hypothetical protein